MTTGFQLPALRSLGELADTKPVIIVDSREKEPRVFTHLRSERGTLATGDYAIKGAEHAASIEVKRIDDIVACVGPERERFERELMRIKAYPFRRLVILCRRAEIEYQRYHSRMAPKSVLHTLAAWEVRYNLPVCYFPDAEAAADQVEVWLWWVAREVARDANNLLRGCSNETEAMQ